MQILYLNNYEKDNFSIKKHGKDKLNLQYNNNNFIIEPRIAFDNCSLFTENNPYKIRFNIDLSNTNHKNFEKMIYILHKEINKYIEKDNELLDMEVMDPLNTSNVLFNTKILYAIINKFTIIKDFDNNNKINIEYLINKRFIVYPSFFAPNINVYNKKLYINFTLNMIYVKIIKKENKENNEDIETINYNNVAEAMNILISNNKTI